MEALIGTFLAAGLGELGDKTQLLVLALVARYGRTGQVLTGVAAGALANAAIAATAGAVIHDMLLLRAVSLLLALAFLYAGLSGLVRPRAPDLPGREFPPALTAAVSFFLIEFGDRSQMLTFALTAQYDAPLLAAAGATAGVIAANLPALALAGQAEKRLRLPTIRIGAAVCFLLTGSLVAINSLRLI